MQKTVLAFTCSVLMCAASAVSAMPGVALKGAPVTLNGSASVTLVNDEAIVTLTKEEQSDNAQKASESVVKEANEAIEALKKFGDKLTLQTTGFNTWPVYTKAADGQIASVGAWGVRQTVKVTIKDVAIVGEVMQTVAPHMNYDGVTFRVSESARKAANDKLLTKAIADAARRATVVAKAMGLTEKNVKIEELNIGSEAVPGPRFYAASMRSDSANTLGMEKSATPAPVLSAGTSDISLNVTMRVRIK